MMKSVLLIMFEGSTDDSLLELDLSVDHNHGMNFMSKLAKLFIILR